MISWFLSLLLSTVLVQKEQPKAPTTSLTFYLRHTHAISNTSQVIFQDVPSSLRGTPFRISAKPVEAHKPSASGGSSRWDSTEVPGPDVERRATLLSLAKMTYNAYNEAPGINGGWYDLGPEWNKSVPFGWELDEDGFRGHIYVADDESTVVIAIKGTSAPWVAGGEGPTKKKDKHNNNMLFSCCCARVGPTWSTVCPCYAGRRRCDIGCVQRALMEDDNLFYHSGVDLYNNVSYMYPASNIWITGHSLGGALASLVGITFGVPSVTFESPGDRLPASRLHLPLPPSTHHITHVYHTADPVPMGMCTGIGSLCALGGFAMESRCHIGKTILYDTVTELRWGVNLRHHPIKPVIGLLQDDWEAAVALGREVPMITDEEIDCMDCDDWEFGDYNKLYQGEL